MSREDSIIESYSRHAAEYAGADNSGSCWGALSRDLWSDLRIDLKDCLVVDVGCGPGTTLEYLAGVYKNTTQLVGVEPAENMRALCRKLSDRYPNIRVCNGRFESLPFQGGSVDYLYSILAFHWVTNAEQAVREIGRVLSPEGSADLFFVGRWNGREFINKTTPIFLKYMGAARLFASAQLRRQFAAGAAMNLFQQALADKTIQVREIYNTYYDSLDGHWRWWVRIAGQLSYLPLPERLRCEEEVRRALQELESPSGIPYTVHLLHTKISPKGRTSGSVQI